MLTTAYSFIATAEAIVAVGALPVFVDIDPATSTLDPTALERAVGPRTKAVIPVHLYGHPCDLDAVAAIATRHGLRVIEDCAQAIGACDRGRRVGAFGDAAALSFYPSKNLGGYGDGGMVLTNDAGIAAQVRRRRAHGAADRYHHTVLGTNSRLDEIQAAILRVKLRYLDQWNAARRRHAAAYGEAFARSGVEGVTLPVSRPGCDHVYHLYVIRTTQRDRMKAALARQGIASDVIYPSILPAQPALEPLGPFRGGPWPQAEAAACEVLSLPMYPELTDELLERVVGCIAATLQ